MTARFKHFTFPSNILKAHCKIYFTFTTSVSKCLNLFDIILNAKVLLVYNKFVSRN